MLPPHPPPLPIQCAHVGRRTWCNSKSCFLTSPYLHYSVVSKNAVMLSCSSPLVFLCSQGRSSTSSALSGPPSPVLVCFVSGQKGPRSPLLLVSFVNSPPPSSPVSFSHCLPAGKIKRWVFMSGPKSPLSSPLTVPMATSSSGAADGGCLPASSTWPQKAEGEGCKGLRGAVEF